MQEFVVLVTDQNKRIGVMPKLDAHNATTPLHRGFSSYVFNKEGKFLYYLKTMKTNPDDYSEWSVLQVAQLKKHPLVKKYIKKIL